MASQVPGWTVPVALGLIEPQLLAGLPFVPAIFLALGTLLGTFVIWFPCCFIGLALYGLGRAVTAIDPQWLDILWGHLEYRGYYEA